MVLSIHSDIWGDEVHIETLGDIDIGSSGIWKQHLNTITDDLSNAISDVKEKRISASTHCSTNISCR